MTDQSDILNVQEAAAPTAAPAVDTSTTSATPNVNPYADKLQAIRHEETGLQKYASVEDALTGTIYAQEHIKRLEQEAITLRAERDAAKVLQEEANAQQAFIQEVQPPAATLGEEDVYSMMEGYEQLKVRQSNRKSVVDTLVQHCNGDEAKASTLIADRLKDLGMSRDQLATLSETTPTAVYKLFGMDGTGTPASDYTSSTINIDAVDTANKGKEIPAPPRRKVGSTMKTLVSEWQASKAEVNQRLGLE
jgi:hypothetical protein